MLAPAFVNACAPLTELNDSACTVTSVDGVPPRSLIRTLRNEAVSPLPWFWMPMYPSRLRFGSVLVKSLISEPFRYTRIRWPSTSSS